MNAVQPSSPSYVRAQEIDAVLGACNEVKQSGKFKKVLEVVLALGNYLNGGSFRGAAYGFKLDVLNKLR